MSDNLTLEDIDKEVRGKIYTQDYSKKPVIDGVLFIDLKNHVGEDGDFSEILRLKIDGALEIFPDFKLAQINRTLILPGAVKAWHLHFNQDEIWYAPPNFLLFVGLWDIRKNSKTANGTMKFSLGGGESQLLYIPKGVAHGYADFSNVPINLYYFTNVHFNKDNPDEHRLPWDSQGKDFWTPQRD